VIPIVSWTKTRRATVAGIVTRGFVSLDEVGSAGDARRWWRDDREFVARGAYDWGDAGKDPHDLKRFLHKETRGGR